MKLIQKEISLESRPRGFHLITNEILGNLFELRDITKGVANIFIKHTSASISINENADPTVRQDMESFFNETVPEDSDFYLHTLEGSDDMTSHIKSTLIGSSVNIPVTNGRFNLGTWQGIYLCEHRNRGGSRNIVVTVFGV
ncbi:MAG: secondary thiamine-phosphate synthase enzyme YjbQ [Ignavibacteria bacterium]